MPPTTGVHPLSRPRRNHSPIFILKNSKFFSQVYNDCNDKKSAVKCDLNKKENKKGVGPKGRVPPQLGSS